MAEKQKRDTPLADALEALLAHSTIPHESEARDKVQGFIDHQRGEDLDDTPADDSDQDDDKTETPTPTTSKSTVSKGGSK
jgi:hypothetical protein